MFVKLKFFFFCFDILLLFMNLFTLSKSLQNKWLGPKSKGRWNSEKAQTDRHREIKTRFCNRVIMVVGKPAAQVSNKIDLRHGWNLLLKSTIKTSVLCQGSTIETSCRWKLSDISKVSVGKPRYLILPNDWQIGLLDYQIIRI